MITRQLLAASLVLFAGLSPVMPAMALDRTKIPAPGTLRPFHFPSWQEAKLANGMPVILVENHNNPVVSAMFILRGGADTDPAGKSGRAYLASELWSKGTATRTAAQIDETTERYGAALGATAGRSETHLALTTLKEHFGTLLPLFADVALNPALPEAEVQREKDLTLTEMKQAEDKVADLAKRELAKRLFPGHAYGELPNGSIQGISALQRQDLQAFFAQQLNAGNAMIVVAGDIEPSTVLAQLNAQFGKAKPGKAVEVALATPKPLAKTGVIVVDKPGAVQSAIRIGTLGLTPKDPDYIAWTVANALLGGLFTSRLNANLREDKGYTYGAGSSFTQWSLPGMVQASTNVETQYTEASVGEMLKEFARLRDSAVPAAELAKAKAYLIGTFPNDFNSAASVGAAVADLKLMGLPASHVRDFRARVAKVTPADVQRVAKRFLDPNRLAIVIAGDAKQFKTLDKFGPLTVVPARTSMAHP